MGLFSFFKPPKPVGFTYHPRFYDEKKEAFQERLKKAEELASDDPEALKNRIRKSLKRKGTYMSDRHYRSRQTMRSNLMLFIIIVLLTLVTFVAIEVYLPKLEHLF